MFFPNHFQLSNVSAFFFLGAVLVLIRIQYGNLALKQQLLRSKAPQKQPPCFKGNSHIPKRPMEMLIIIINYNYIYISLSLSMQSRSSTRIME